MGNRCARHDTDIAPDLPHPARPVQLAMAVCGAQVVALAGTRTLIYITYTDRGHDALWKRFLARRVETHFHVVELPPHLLHPVSQPGAVDRLEQGTPRYAPRSFVEPLNHM